MKLSSEWHKSVWGRIDAQIILYAKTGTPQYITAPEPDIRSSADTANPSLGVWFGPCKGSHECVCVCFRGVTGRRLCFDYIFLKLGDLRVGGGGGPDLRFADDGDKKNLINS